MVHGFYKASLSEFIQHDPMAIFGALCDANGNADLIEEKF